MTTRARSTRTSAELAPAAVFDCRRRRHKVLAGDGICVLCGRRDVVDARLLPQPLFELAEADSRPRGHA